MLEEIPAETEFQKLKQNYDNLFSTYKAIRKAEKQTQLLKPLSKEYTKNQVLFDKKTALSTVNELLPVFFAHEKMRLLDYEIIKIQKNQKVVLDKLKNTDKDLKALHEQERNLDIEINNNEKGVSAIRKTTNSTAKKIRKVQYLCPSNSIYFKSQKSRVSEKL